METTPTTPHLNVLKSEEFSVSKQPSQAFLRNIQKQNVQNLTARIVSQTPQQNIVFDTQYGSFQIRHPLLSQLPLGTQISFDVNQAQSQLKLSIIEILSGVVTGAKGNNTSQPFVDVSLKSHLPGQIIQPSQKGMEQLIQQLVSQTKTNANDLQQSTQQLVKQGIDIKLISNSQITTLKEQMLPIKNIPQTSYSIQNGKLTILTQGVPQKAISSNYSILETFLGQVKTPHLTAKNNRPLQILLETSLSFLSNYQKNMLTSPEDIIQRVEGNYAKLAPLFQNTQGSSLQMLLPSAGNNFSQAFMMLLFGMKGGNLSQILNNSGKQLPKSQEKILSMLKSDWQDLNQLSQKSQSEGRLFILPVFDGSKMDKVHIYLPPDDKNNNNQSDGSEDKEQFIVEAELSQMGAFQFEGVINKETVDLTIRYKQSMDKQIKRDIRKIFHQVIESMNYSGHIYFNQVKEFDVFVKQEVIDTSKFTKNV